MAKAAKKTSKQRASCDKEFVVARQVVRSDKFTSRQLREAIRKVKAARRQRESV